MEHTPAEHTTILPTLHRLGATLSRPDEQLGLLDKIEEYVVKIPRGDRSGSVVEPYLTEQG